MGVSNETSYGVMRFFEIAKQLGLPKIVSIQNSYSLLVRSSTPNGSWSLSNLALSTQPAGDSPPVACYPMTVVLIFGVRYFSCFKHCAWNVGRQLPTCRTCLMMSF